jgi:hypothetical protein
VARGRDPAFDIKTEFTRLNGTFQYASWEAKNPGAPVPQQYEKENRPGFLQSAPAHVTLVIATMLVLLIFAWNYI